ncbi:MAG: DUF4055 domain-containing protein [Gemmatimonadota bacterium]
MSIESKHPDFIEVSDDYRVMRDTFAGERRIKEGTFAYLPPTGGQIADGAVRNVLSSGAIAYSNYLTRAVFPDFVNQAVQVMVGVMHREPARIELPTALEPMRDNATRKGETLLMLLRRINEQQLVFGRHGILIDFPQESFAASQAQVPHLVEYQAETIINWDDERFTEFGVNVLNFLVLNETVQVRGAGGIDIFDWEQERRFRVAHLEPLNPDLDVSASNPMVYKTFVENDDVRTDEVTPMFQGRPLEEIPFVFIGANDMNLKPDEIPLLGLANLSLAIYRGEADFRQTLHLLGQDTLVIVGDENNSEGDLKDETQDTRVGAGAVIRIQAGEGSKAEFIGIDSKGAPEQAKALQADRRDAQSLGARLLEPRGTQAESGEALKIRVAASTSTLHTIALTGAAGLEEILRKAAVWIGANPDEVKVIPNLDFAQETPDPEQLKNFAEAREAGAPISLESIHLWAQGKNFTKKTFEEEQPLLEKEQAERDERATAIAEQTRANTPPGSDEPGEETDG